MITVIVLTTEMHKQNNAKTTHLQLILTVLFDMQVSHPRALCGLLNNILKNICLQLQLQFVLEL